MLTARIPPEQCPVRGARYRRRSNPQVHRRDGVVESKARCKARWLNGFLDTIMNIHMKQT